MQISTYINKQLIFFFSIIRVPARSTLFPYTTLFRSAVDRDHPRREQLSGCPQRQEVLQINPRDDQDRKSTRLNSSHVAISYAVFCLKKKKPSQQMQLLNA